MFYNPFERIKELNRRILDRDSKIRELNKQIEDLIFKQKESNHNPDETCKGCKNHIRVESGYSAYVEHFCKLNNNCPDSEEE